MKALLVSLLLISVFQTVHADPLVLGNPNSGKVIADIKDGKDQVKVTTQGLLVKDTDDDAADTKETATVTKHHHSDDADEPTSMPITVLIQNTVVPLMFFLFLLAAILGKRFLASRNEQRRLDLIRAMLDKGQPVPESVVNQLLTPARQLEAEGPRSEYKRTRNAYCFTMAGVGLIVYALATHKLGSEDILIPALVFFCLGVGGLAGLYLPKQREEKIVK